MAYVTCCVCVRRFPGRSERKLEFLELELQTVRITHSGCLELNLCPWNQFGSSGGVVPTFNH